MRKDDHVMTGLGLGVWRILLLPVTVFPSVMHVDHMLKT
jgi:hypothetical protein